MIELTFEDFHEGNFLEEGFVLYVLKNGLDDVLYVGISKKNIWSRWFAFGGHMIWDGKHIIGQSAVGQKIFDHLPDSLNWKIQLWRLALGIAKIFFLPCDNIQSSLWNHS
jgi:hypothetical protein